MENVNIAFIISAIGACIAFYTVVVAAYEKPSVCSKWLVYTAVCAFSTMIAYCWEVTGTTEGEILTAIKIGYFYKIFSQLCFLYFVLSYFGLKKPKWIPFVIIPINLTILLAVFTCEKHNLYYASYELEYNGSFYYLDVERGPVYILMITTMIAVSVAYEYNIIKTFAKAKKEEKEKILLILLTGIIPLAMLVVMGVVDTHGFDLVPIGFSVVVLIFMALIKHFGILNTIEVARSEIIKQTKDGLLVVDTNNRVLFINDAAHELFPRLDVMTILNDDEYETIFESKDDIFSFAGKHVELRISDLNQGDIMMGRVVWMFDMSFINEYTDQIMVLKEEAERANIEKTLFLANMSHEIRTPMNAVNGFSEIVLGKTRERETAKNVNDILRAGSNLLNIINRVLDISKIESGKHEVVLNEYYVQNLIDDTVMLINVRAQAKQLKFTVSVDENIPYMLIGDKGNIYEVLINVLGNSVKYTEEGGVTFTIKSEDIDENHVNLIFTVTDTGVGMTKESIEKIYDKFSRFDTDKNKNIEGTGLGMAIVKGILDQMNGEIDITSEYGDGTTTVVKIPQERCGSKTIKDGVAPYEDLIDSNNEFEFTTTANILIVDDSEVNLRLTVSMLRKYGIEADYAFSGAEAIEKCKYNKYDLIFMDHMMPEMDGVVAFHKLKDLEYIDSSTKVVALTANAVLGVKEKMEKEGFDGYLTKPIDTGLLERMLIDKLPISKVNKIKKNANLAEIDSEKFYSIQEKCPHIDVRKGIKYSGGSVEDYLDIISYMYHNAPVNISKIEALYSEENWPDYIISVHALKSSMAGVGADELSAMAKKLELTGKDGNFDYIKANHTYVMDMYRMITFEMGCACGQLKETLVGEHVEETANPEYDMTKEEILELFNNIYSMIENFEHDKALEIINEISEFKIDKDSRAIVNELKGYLDNIELQKAMDFIKTLVT